MDNIEGKVIIIDNNVSNGFYLSACCLAVMPKSQVKWVRVSGEDDEDLSFSMPKTVAYESAISLKEAADIINRDTSSTREIIVFYNLRLGSYQGNVEKAIRSPITTAVKGLVESGRRILVNVHSTEIPTRKLAETIDPLFKTDPRSAKVICHHLITGALPDTILAVVKETLDEWKRRNPANGRRAQRIGVAS